MKKGKRQKIESLGQRHTRQETISGYLFISPLLPLFLLQSFIWHLQNIIL